MDDSKVTLPVAELEPRPVTLDQYRALTPEKLELVSGYLIAPPDSPEERHRLLSLLLVNVGLAAAVKLAPEARWREALERAYG
jgi:hypothetical protein